MSAILTLSPTSFSFGTVRVGTQSVYQTLLISNTGTSTLNITAAPVSGPFVLTGLSLPAAIGPSGSLSVLVLYAPVTAGSQTGSIIFSHNGPGPTTTFPLSGVGTTGSVLSQERTVRFIGPSIQSFDITSSLSTPGSLPTGAIFVYQISDRLDPKSDVFNRVAVVADLTTLPNGRDAGLLANPASNVFEYLTSTVVNSYADLATAVAAQQVIQDRVGVLVADWESYSNTFEAEPPVLINVPTNPTVTPPSTQVFINAYAAAKLARGAAQTAVNTATTTLGVDLTLLTNAKALSVQIQKFYVDTVTGSLDGAVQRTAEMTNAYSWFNNLYLAGNTFIALASCVLSTDVQAFQLALNNALNYLTLTSQGVSNHTAYEGNISSYLTATNTTLATLQTTYNTDSVTLATAQVTLTQAQTTEATTLAALLAVCPDYDYAAVCAC